MNRLGHKLVALAVIFLCMFIPGILPIKISEWFEKRGAQGRTVLSVIMCFGGGVFFGTYLLHMTPEVQKLIEKTINKGRDVKYPVAYAIIGAGFFLMLFLEKITLELQNWRERRRMKNRVKVMDTQLKSISIQQVGVVGNANEAFHAEDPIRVPIEGRPIPSGHQLDDLPRGDGDDGPGHSHSEGHSHLQGSAAKSLVLMLALSVDSLFEGLSLGLQKTSVGVWRLVLAILSHEIVIAFSLGIQLNKNNSKLKAFGMSLAYSLMCPVGIAIGTAIMEAANKDMDTDLVYGVLLGISAGVFVYVAFFEILIGEIAHEVTWVKLLAVLLGFGVLAALMVLHNSAEDSGY